VSPCDPARAEKHTGYQVGGTSPFGLRRAGSSTLVIHVEASILGLERIYINAGRRGLLASMSPAELVRALTPTPVSVARE
jgi:prolyl-tRNA editing enzyme YbaK/EbsC (Cys-tRNA(Pro) deacylase)